MRLLYKLLLILLVVTFIPMTVTGYLLNKVSQKEISRDISEIQRLTALNLSVQIKEYMLSVQKNLASAFDGIPLIESESPIKIKILRWGINQNLWDFRIMSLLHPDGKFVMDSQYLPSNLIPSDHQSEIMVTEEDVAVHHNHINYLDSINSGEEIFSPVYWNQRRKEPLITHTYALRDRPSGEIRYLISAEISLKRIQALISQINLGTQSLIYVVDEHRTMIASQPFKSRVENKEFLESVVSYVEKVSPKYFIGNIEFNYESTHGKKDLIIGAYSYIENLHWNVIIVQPKEFAMASSYTMQTRIILFSFITIIMACACGVIFVRSITKRVDKCVNGAHAIAKGDFGHKIELKSKDEIDVLAATFNDMGASLQESRTEIESWNKELKKLIEEKTKELKETQLQLIQSSKMTAIGQLGAGISHEINNPLTGILGQAQLLKRKLLKLQDTNEQIPGFIKYLDNIEKESKRCKVIINSLAKLSIREDSGMVLINLNEILKTLVILYENRLKKNNIILKLNFQEHLPTVKANETQIQQVFMNLITNAYQAMPNDGILEIITYSNDARDVIVEIVDSGKGIPYENLSRIFEPFFTTKEVWTNTGLGLSICYAIIQEHKGEITVESKVGKGSRFRVVLPAN
ncbi:MAG: hypothetical protein A2161_13595 [Candidatus Schekmanbacteria bacterium RBG_13_48_7]|uniref:histidine kinase n=1 Tax=Candidatus Schekmanbacteria bacterium RBG_13_48_7 TaxID=1817878 RepID=A0A1F7RM84_9BACT|nr:MAG: hypothetical protein A2161_13595 [Candidatus Schekmanbacteria bacterium RBG_13_48_7]